MIVSRCHSDHVDVIDYNNAAYYVCKVCQKPCDTKLSFWEYNDSIDKEVLCQGLALSL